MLPGAHIDFETRSDLDLRKVGIARYCESIYTDVWIMCWGFDAAKVNRWFPGNPDPLPLLQWVASGGRVVAHNAAFERWVWNRFLRGFYCAHWPALRIEQQDCTMARALNLGLPGDLDRAAPLVGSPFVKDEEGHALMLKMSRPKGRHNPPQFETDPVKIERLALYCEQDVRSEFGIDERALYLSAQERRVWEMDQRMNDRGIALDIPLIRQVVDVLNIAKAKANARVHQLTNGELDTTTQSAALAQWLTKRGIPTRTVAAEATEELLQAADLGMDGVAHEVIELRRNTAKASAYKFEAMLRCACSNGRAYGLVAYYAAITGRWAGRLIQPQNFLRVDADRDAPTVEMIHAVFRSGLAPEQIHDLINDWTGPLLDKEFTLRGVIPWLGKMQRSMIVAEPGNKLIGGDLSNIEGRVNAWMAGEEWKVNAFFAYDAKTGPDLYELAYSTSFNVDVSKVDKAQRQLGKVQELALGYQGSVGAFRDMGKNYGLKPGKVRDAIMPITDPLTWQKVSATYDAATSKASLDRDTWTALKIVVNAFRAANASITQGWWDLQDAALAAVDNPGVVYHAYNGKVRYRASHGFLWCALPSGRVLAYYRPRIKVERVNNNLYFLADGQRVRADEAALYPIVFHEDGSPVTPEELEGRPRYVVQYDGLSDTKQWVPQTLYGGMQCNHVVQGTARDVIVNGMLRLEAAGYGLILPVHDEIVSENQHGFGGADEYQRYLTAPIDWLPHFPLAAKTWEAARYIK